MEKLRPTFTFTEERLRELQQVVPEAFADGKINWEVLREALGEYLEDETQEHFGLTWPGKREARRLAALPPQGTLVPTPGEGVDEETTHHLFIEGENLEVLKLLQKSYAGRVKMIYIDPPYNTGNDFIYEDDYSEPLETYLKRTGQMDEAGRRLTTNTRASGRFHSKWLSMIYPRLLLARQLLREDGVIFVSIDEVEQANLQVLMNEIFGEENFISILIRRAKIGGGSDNKQYAKESDFILVYAKNAQNLPVFYIPHSLQELKRYSEEDENGRYFWDTYSRSGLASDDPESETLYYTVQFPDGSQRADRWRRSFKRLQDDLKKGEAKFVLTSNGWNIHFKQRLNPLGKRPRQILYDSEFGNSQGNQDFEKIFAKNFFSYPKPVSLIKHLVMVSCRDDPNAIVCDFFAGTGTLAQAILELNREFNIQYRFVLVQLNEPTENDSLAYKEGFSTIAEIGKERIRRVIRKMKEEQNGQLPLPATEDGQPSPLDLGFKVLKLTRSHFREWTPLPPTDAQTLDSLFEQQASPLMEGWTKEGLLSEILLLEGFPLDSRVIPLDGFDGNTLWRVHHEEIGHELMVCLDETIQPATVERLKSGEILRRDDLFICLDSALTDEAKVVLDDRLRLKVI